MSTKYIEFNQERSINEIKKIVFFVLVNFVLKKTCYIFIIRTNNIEFIKINW
jgi:hypothetical protein